MYAVLAYAILFSFILHAVANSFLKFVLASIRWVDGFLITLKHLNIMYDPAVCVATVCAEDKQVQNQAKANTVNEEIVWRAKTVSSWRNWAGFKNC